VNKNKGHKQKIQVAEETPVNDTNLPYEADDTQTALEKTANAIALSASPGFTWGSGGTVTSGSYLYNDDVVSNKAGRLVPFDGTVAEFFVNNDNTSGSKVLELRRRRPCQTGSWITLASITLDDGNSCGAFAVDEPVEQGDELAVRVSTTSSNFKNPIVGIIIKNSSTGGGTSSDGDVNRVTSCYDSTGSIDITSGWTDITMDTTRISSTTIASHTAGQATITANRDGLYRISFSISIEQTAGNSRSDAAGRLLLDTGSGFAQVPGSLVYIYSRQNTIGVGSASCSFCLELSTDDVIKIQAQKKTGGGTLKTIADGCYLEIQYLRSGI